MQIVEPIPAVPASRPSNPPSTVASSVKSTAGAAQKDLQGEFRCDVSAMGAQLASQNYALADNFLDEASSLSPKPTFTGGDGF